MAYITNSNAKNIIRKTELKFLDLRGDVYKTPIAFLNRLEVNRMLAIKELFSDSEMFFKEYYMPIKTKDTLTLVYEGKKPAYHCKPNCIRLTADYENFEIPNLIKEKGQTEVEKFRKWFNEHRHLMEEPDKFVMRLQNKWGVSTNVKNIKKPNAGVSQFDDFTAADIENKIDQLLELANTLIAKNPEILTKYCKQSYLGKLADPLLDNNTGFSDQQIKGVLQEFESKVKSPLNPLLVTYYKITLNPELNFHENILKQLGFVRCSYCYKESELNNNFTTKTNDIKVPENIITTFELIKRGLRIEEIANKRAYTKETIIKHIVKIAEISGPEELISIKPNTEVLTKVKNALDIIQNRDQLRPIYEFLNQEIDYNTIRIALIFIK